jgi:hypothetical protein
VPERGGASLFNEIDDSGTHGIDLTRRDPESSCNQLGEMGSRRICNEEL